MNKMELNFSAKLDNVHFVKTAVSAFLMPLNPTLDEVIEVKTIVAEAVSNAIIHGYNQNEQCDVFVCATIEERNLHLVVQDFGKGIENLEQVKIPFYTTAKELEHAGMGITIIDTLCDHFDIESVINIGTKLTMSKTLKDNGKLTND